MGTIREQLNGIERLLGAIDAKQSAADDALKELGKKVDGQRDDIAEALALGQRVHEMAGKVDSNTDAISKIETWRQRRIGAAGLLHTLGAGFGAIVGAVIERFMGGHH